MDPATKRVRNPLAKKPKVKKDLEKKYNVLSKVLVYQKSLQKSIVGSYNELPKCEEVDSNYQTQVADFMSQWNVTKFHGKKRPIGKTAAKTPNGEEYIMSTDGGIMESDSDGEVKRKQVLKLTTKNSACKIKKVKKKNDASMEELQKKLIPSVKEVDPNVSVMELIEPEPEPTEAATKKQKTQHTPSTPQLPLALQPFFTYHDEGDQISLKMRKDIVNAMKKNELMSSDVLDTLMNSFQNGLNGSVRNGIGLSFVLDKIQQDPKMWIPGDASHLINKLMASADLHDRKRRYQLLTPPNLPFHRPCEKGSECEALKKFSHLQGFFQPRECLTEEEEKAAIENPNNLPTYVKPCLICKSHQSMYFFVNSRAECKNVPPRVQFSDFFNPVGRDGEYHISQAYMSSAKQYQNFPLPQLWFFPKYYQIEEDENGIPHYVDSGFIDPGQLRRIEQQLFR